MIDFIEVYDDVLDIVTCNRLRQLFEQPELVRPGVTGHGVEPDKKLSQDIMLNQHLQCADLLQTVTEAARNCMVQYFTKYHFALIAPLSLKVRTDSGAIVNLTHENYAMFGQGKEESFMRMLYRMGSIQTQKYEKGLGNYNYWHCEVFPQKGSTEALHRSLLFMFYLNDVVEGGETDFFYQQRSIQPRQGRMVIAPAYFTHTHRGKVPVSDDKYILTSWVLLNQGDVLFS